MSARTPEAEPLLTPAEVATMFRVDPKTVTRWARAGKLTSVRTLGGHRRYREAEVRALLAGTPGTSVAEAVFNTAKDVAEAAYRDRVTQAWRLPTAAGREAALAEA